MKITPISAFNVYKTNKQNKIQYKNNLPFDTVSFSAKKKTTSTNTPSKNVTEGMRLGEKVLFSLQSGTSKKDIIKLVQQETPTLTVQSMNDAPNITGNIDFYSAFLTYPLADDFSMNQIIMYLNTGNYRIGDKVEKLTFAMDIAHEYTHVRQVLSGEHSKFYKKISNGDMNLAKTLIGLCNMTFQLMDQRVQESSTIKFFSNPQDMYNTRLYDKEVPRECTVTKQELLDKAGCKTEEEFLERINDEYKRAFVAVFKFAVNNPDQLEKPVLDTLKSFKKKEEVDDLFEKTKQLCAFNAKCEIEARTTEANLAKKSLGIKETSNFDVYPIYYKMLYKALK